MIGFKSDETLMLQYQQGNYKAFEKLYSRHKLGLFRFMLGMCADRVIVEELYQDVWMKLIDTKSRYRVEAKFSTFLYQIARNRVIDHLRKHSTQFEQNSSDIQDLSDSLDRNAQHSAEQETIADQTKNIINQLLHQLPFKQREVFLLKENTGLSLKQIAVLIGENEETVKTRLRYALKKLRLGLEKNGQS